MIGWIKLSKKISQIFLKKSCYENENRFYTFLDKYQFPKIPYFAIDVISIYSIRKKFEYNYRNLKVKRTSENCACKSTIKIYKFDEFWLAKQRGNQKINIPCLIWCQQICIIKSHTISLLILILFSEHTRREKKRVKKTERITPRNEIYTFDSRHKSNDTWNSDNICNEDKVSKLHESYDKCDR